MQKIFFFIAFYLLTFDFLANGEIAPVMLYAGKSMQNDSLGFNIVNDLSDVVYRAVLNGTVKLWDSEQKTLQILPSSLQKIEKSSSVTFSGCEHIFIYEQWTLEKKLSSAEILGFYFSAPSPSGQTVSFGYVDAKDLPDTVLGTYVHLNENGGEPITILRVLRCKLYAYSIMQYKGKKVSGAEESRALKKEKAEQLLHYISCPELKEMKTVVYSVGRDDSMYDAEGRNKSILLLETIEDFFTDNRETLLNIGGAAALEYKVNKNFKVTSMTVNEVWTKENGIINSEPQIITLFINNRPINALSIKDFLALGIVHNFKSVYDVLKEKDFSLVILQINGNEIPYKYSKSYFNALMKYKWNGISEYVKYD